MTQSVRGAGIGVNFPQVEIDGRKVGLASLREAATFARCSTDTIRRRVADGSLTGYRFGPRSLRVDLDELAALMRQVPTA